MKKFMDLIIESNDFGMLKKILRQITEELDSNWKFRRDLLEESGAKINKEPDEIGCFEYPDMYGESVFVWMVISENELKIVNIVTSGVISLTSDDYNRILNLFYRQCVDHVIRNKEVRLTITASVYEIKKLAGDYTYEALLNWVQNYSPVTGNSDSNDFTRWADFVCTAFDEGSQLSSGLLRRWLIEQRKWRDDEMTKQVAINYGNCLSILEHYDQNY
ncbi:MAG TPA: hypothetical protein VKA49_16150 [Flavitalea sp.]|nr:hypothetical protein [Flavitalea sp.]